MSYAVDLGLTLAVEVPVVAGIARVAGGDVRRGLVVAVAANLLTHPLLWFVLAPWLHDRLGLGGLLLAEAAVVAVEAAVYARSLRPRPGAWLAGWVALLANAVSLALGVALR